MEAVGLAFGVVATIDLCLKYGKILMEAYKDFVNAGTEVNERFVRVLNIWTRIRLQLDFVRSIENTFSTEYRAVQEATLRVLETKLQRALGKLDTLAKTPNARTSTSDTDNTGIPRIKQWKYICTKSSIDECIEELQSWQATFDPTWLLAMRISGQYGQIVDEQLTRRNRDQVIQSAADIRDAIKSQAPTTKEVFLRTSGLDSLSAIAIPYSGASFVPRSESKKWVVVDPIPYNGQDRDIQTKDVRELASRLSHADPSSCSILKCRGVVKSVDYKGRLQVFRVVFNTPTETVQHPETLRQHLVEQTLHSLTQRIAFARHIATAISFVHTLGFVHKNVRPETLIKFNGSDASLNSLYLIGFEHFRTADGRTYRQENCAWSKDLYRHPDRQGPVPSADYCMQHDIYSLGVCLLEVGLWTSFLLYDYEGRSVVSVKVPDLIVQDATSPGARAVKDHLVFLAEARLPSHMGDVYAGIVLNCLTCLDESNADFGDRGEFEDADGVLVGAKYIHKILLKLNSIQV